MKLLTTKEALLRPFLAEPFITIKNDYLSMSLLTAKQLNMLTIASMKA